MARRGGWRNWRNRRRGPRTSGWNGWSRRWLLGSEHALTALQRPAASKPSQPVTTLTRQGLAICQMCDAIPAFRRRKWKDDADAQQVNRLAPRILDIPHDT